MHYCHAGVCIKLNRLDEALTHLKMVERLSPNWHLMWVVKWWQSIIHREVGRWEEANTAVDETMALLPSFAMAHVKKALCCIHRGQDAEARRHVGTAYRLGWDLTLAERLWRRMRPNSQLLEADIAAVRSLYAEVEPGA
jgi:tetratricopeptide (TPR) repeat protein